MQQNGFVYLAANGMHRRKRTHRLLKDHSDIFAANVADLRASGMKLRQVSDAVSILTGAGRMEQNLSRVDTPGRGDDAQDGMGGHRFAAAAFTDNP